MAKSRFIQNNFLSGELSPLLKGNTGIEQYYQGAEKAQNLLIVPQGGVKRRAGLAYGLTPYKVLNRLTDTPNMPNGGTASNINDGDTATTTATTTAIGTNDPYVIADYDLGVAKQIALIDLKEVSLTVGSSDEFKIQHSDDGASWSGSYRNISLNTTTSNKRITIGSSHRYWRFVRIGSTDLGAAVVNVAEFNLLEETATLSEVKLLGISPEVGVDYLGIVTDGNIQIVKYSAGTLIVIENQPAPYLSAELSTLRHVVLGSVCLLFHEDHPTKRLINFGDPNVDAGSNTNPYDDFAYWNIDDAPFSNVPVYDYNDSLSPTPVSEQQDVVFGGFSIGMQYKIDVKGVFSKNISYAGDTTVDQQTSTAENLRKNLQDMPVFGETGIAVARVGVNQYRITISGESADAYNLFSGFNTTGSTTPTLTFTKVVTGSPRREAVWSATRGYPRMGAFFEGRLWIGGAKSKPQTLFASKSGSLFDFDTGGGEDDEGIFQTISDNRLSGITDVYSGRNLQVFTSSGERADLSSGITPATINVKKQTSNGSLYIPVQEADGSVIYCDQNGKTLREFNYSFNEDAYVSTDITVLSSHLIKTPAATAFLTGTASDDSNWLFIVNSDGTGAVLNKLRSQDINGFTSIDTNGTLKDVAVFGDEVAFVADRTINGSSVRFIEFFNFLNRMDCSIIQQYSGLTVSGLEHLEGHTVDVRIDNIGLSQRAVTGGAVTLTAEEASGYDSSNTVEVGINFSVALKSMPINTSIGSGSNVMRLKRIVKMNMRVYETTGVYVDGVQVMYRGYGEESFGQPVLFTGVLGDFYSSTGWDRDAVPEITCPGPTAFHLQAIEYEVGSS